MLQSTPTPAKTHAIQQGSPANGSGRAPLPRQMPALRWETPALAAMPAGVSAQASAATSQVSLRYLESSPVRVRGPVTGIHYKFSGTRPIEAVDARDAPALMRTRFFRQA